ncbi:cytochrome b/b6 domain-containing protein [Sphingomonas abietis]|uniref:Cytochrome b/b6 domain-containing protein n=1 Tax=Sphingomonas abietis TaxID=3012344 RepID=A0ABY7NRK2_9SPHN|nr:cytochrome b/b6 domain-containing protein [Sphingomonas abietis]WBO23430.1 cytochrome b/b6 domain-containing protein [Sphingomonas abietis]
MTQDEDATPPAAPADADGARGGDIVARHRLVTRLWHGTNAFSVFVMLMSGLMIFNAHPHLYWGQYGANFDHSWLDILPGRVRVGPWTIPTPGVLGVQAGGRIVAFPPLVTIPSHYDLASARQWHFAFAWLLVVPGLLFGAWGFAARHFQRDLAPSAAELKPAHLLHDIGRHVRLRFPTGAAARRYNILQKLAYLTVLFVLLPGVALTGLTMSPAMDAAWPWLLHLFGGRPSARSIHFLCAFGLALFILVHLVMVVLAGPINEIRSMITGRYRLPKEKGE